MLWEPGKNWNWKPPKSRVYSNRSCGKHEEGLSIKATGWSDRLGVDASSWWPQLPMIRLFYESPMEKNSLPNLFELNICKSWNKGGREEIKMNIEWPFLNEHESRILLDFLKSLSTARVNSAGNKHAHAKFGWHECHPASRVSFAISSYHLPILVTTWRLDDCAKCLLVYRVATLLKTSLTLERKISKKNLKDEAERRSLSCIFPWLHYSDPLQLARLETTRRA